MKTAHALVLIVLVGVLGWALPAGAEKALLTDAQLDEISAGLAPPSPDSARVSAQTVGNAVAIATATSSHMGVWAGCATTGGTCSATLVVSPKPVSVIVSIPGVVVTSTSK